jgi:hypothetical protein
MKSILSLAFIAVLTVVSVKLMLPLEVEAADTTAVVMDTVAVDNGSCSYGSTAVEVLLLSNFNMKTKPSVNEMAFLLPKTNFTGFNQI